MLNRSAPGITAALAVSLVFGLFFLRIRDIPGVHGDESSLLDVPYRFATFGDLRYPVFIADSFGSDSVRLYPPFTALLLRSIALRLTGFSAYGSRLFSACLILAAVVAAVVWMRRNLGVAWSTATLSLIPAATAPALLVAARSTRIEQETFFFGCLAFLLLTDTGRACDRSARLRIALAAACATFAGGMHPFGVIYPAVGTLIVLAGRQLDRIRSWIGGALIGALPTVVWILVKGSDFSDFRRSLETRYSDRGADLIAWLSRFESVSWLRAAGLSDSVLARIASVQHAAFTEYLGFPAPDGPWSLVLRASFWMQTVTLAVFLIRFLRGRAQHQEPIAALVLLALMLLAFNFAYVPNTTYGLYGAFHVPFAFAAICLSTRGAASRRIAGMALGLAVVSGVGFGITALAQTSSAPRRIAFDEEREAISDIARAAGVSASDLVMTSTETWSAAGARNVSLFECLHYGSCRQDHDALVYRRSYALFHLTAGLPVGEDERRRAFDQRRLALRSVFVGLHLAAILRIGGDDAVYVYRRRIPLGIALADLTVAGASNLRMVEPALAPVDDAIPHVVCGDEPLPDCRLLEGSR